MQAAKTISDLFQYNNHQIQQLKRCKIQEEVGAVTFEGYDKLPKEIHSEKSVFLDVITGRELPKTTVLITSRPWAGKRMVVLRNDRIFGFGEVFKT